MGYATSREVLESRRDWLTELEAGRACRWTTTPDPQVTKDKAYKIREALYIASLYPDEYPALAAARYNFSIFIIEPGVIEAKPRSSQTAPAVRLAFDGPPIHGIGPFGKEQSTVGKSRAEEVIAAWNAHAPSLDPINFQQSNFTVEELTELYEWAVAHRPPLMILRGEGFLTISLRDAEVVPYAWTPPKPEPKPEPKYDL